jgi:hypothetical protein
MIMRYTAQRLLMAIFLVWLPSQAHMAAQDVYLIDDRSSVDINASSGNQWRLVTDSVMGGVSQGQLTPTVIDDRACLRMQGQVKLENNGGFVQAALDLSPENISDIASYTGIMLEVQGNDEPYNIHLRTSNLWLPWQSYRATFTATPTWNTLYIPFSDFKAYRIRKSLNIKKLKRIALVAIGREFSADLCIGKVGLYQ